MASIVGRRAAPKGVARKFAGRSVSRAVRNASLDKSSHRPVIHAGMGLPVRKPTTSLVKELQLKSEPIVKFHRAV